MSRGTFKTTVLLNDGDIEVPVRVVYSRYAGFRGSMEQPPEDASVEIVSITETDPAILLPAHYEADDNLIAECMQDWADEAEDAAEWRAQCRRDDALMGEIS